MIHSVNNWQGMTAYGVNALTGEACRHGTRLLCDLSDKGVDLLSDFLGLVPSEGTFPDNWNSFVGDAPAVASVMLPRTILVTLATFAMFRAGCAFVATSVDGSIRGYTPDDIERYKLDAEKLESLGYFVQRNPAVGSGSRNTHAMTGRTV